jgi:cell division protein ZapA
MGELLSVKVSIANRTYPLRITKEEEDKVSLAAQSVNKCIKEFEDNYAVKDKQDLLAMCSLQFASEAMGHHKKGPKQQDQTQEINDHLDKLVTIIDGYLADENNS